MRSFVNGKRHALHIPGLHLTAMALMHRKTLIRGRFGQLVEKISRQSSQVAPTGKSRFVENPTTERPVVAFESLKHCTKVDEALFAPTLALS